MCVAILRSIGTQLTNLDTSDRYFDQEHFEISQNPLRFLRLPVQVMAPIVVFMFLVTLTLTYDLCSNFVTRTGHDVLESPCEVS